MEAFSFQVLHERKSDSVSTESVVAEGAVLSDGTVFIKHAVSGAMTIDRGPIDELFEFPVKVKRKVMSEAIMRSLNRAVDQREGSPVYADGRQDLAVSLVRLAEMEEWA